MENQILDLEQNKNEFVEIFNQNIKREGADELLTFLLNSDFFDAPASTKFHSAVPGGLCFHSLNVFKRFVKILESEYGENWQNRFSLESATICGLLHDVCKVGFYKQDFKNVKVGSDWVKQPIYTVADSLPYGHGEKSVYIVSSYIKLTREEAMAINWHMGAFDARVKGGSYSIAEAYYTYPTSFLFNIADMEATYLDETR